MSRHSTSQHFAGRGSSQVFQKHEDDCGRSWRERSQRKNRAHCKQGAAAGSPRGRISHCGGHGGNRRPSRALIVCHVAAEPLVPWTIIPGPVSLLYESPAAAVPTSTNLAASCNSDLVWWSPRSQVSRAQGFIPPGGSSGQSFPRRVQLPGPQPTSPRPLLWPHLLSNPDPPSFHSETPRGDSGPSGVPCPSQDRGVASAKALSPGSVTQARVRGRGPGHLPRAVAPPPASFREQRDTSGECEARRRSPVTAAECGPPRRPPAAGAGSALRASPRPKPPCTFTLRPGRRHHTARRAFARTSAGQRDTPSARAGGRVAARRAPRLPGHRRSHSGDLKAHPAASAVHTRKENCAQACHSKDEDIPKYTPEVPHRCYRGRSCRRTKDVSTSLSPTAATRAAVTGNYDPLGTCWVSV